MNSSIIVLKKRSVFLLVFCFILVLAGNHAQMTGLAKHPPIQRIAAMFVWFRRELDDADLQETQWTGRFSMSLCCQWVCTGHCLLISCLPHICSSSRGRSAPGIQQCSCQCHLLLEWLSGCRHCISEHTSFVSMLEGRKHVRNLVIIFNSHLKLSYLPVVILKAINFSNFSLSKCLLSNLLFACCTGKTRNMVCSLQCTDYLISNSLATSPAKFQTGLRE